MSYLTIINTETGETQFFGDKNEYNKANGKPYRDVYGNYITQEEIIKHEDESK